MVKAKKLFCVAAAVFMMISLASCRNGGTDQKNDGESKTETSSKNMSDVDLTVMSSTMVYSEVYNMLTYPEEYIGRNITMKGLYAKDESAYNGNVYHFCIISDATACCAQGIEFILKPDELYPDSGEEFTVSGVFETYYEDTAMYCHLNNAVIVKK
ncbi:MAG: hypothetical protein J5874_00730 [Oscillospiraceae bacterium]|nr:hypothetical protein [Oscillospiraceae bacterium]